MPTLTAKTWAFSSEAALREEREGRQKPSTQLLQRLFMPRALALPRAKEMELGAQRSGEIFLASHSKGEMRWFHPVIRHSVPILWLCGDLRVSFVLLAWPGTKYLWTGQGCWNHLTFSSLALRPSLSPRLSPSLYFPPVFLALSLPRPTAHRLSPR